MHQETNLDKLNRFGHAAVFSGDHDEAIKIQKSLLHDDFEIVEAPSLPYGGTYRGLDGWHELIRKIMKIWSGVRVTPLYTLGEPDGDRFAKMYRLSGASSATGKKFDTTIFELWEFKDGKIHRTRPYYWDTKELADLHSA